MNAVNPRPVTNSRNPGPRPALRREGGEPDGALAVARPGSGAAGEEASPQERRIRIAPTPGQRRPHDSDPSAGSRPAEGEGKVKGTKKNAKKEKRSKKDKKKGKKKENLSGLPLSDVVPPELTVALPKPLRRALAEAATQRDVAPELLVAQVLSEWLDH